MCFGAKYKKFLKAVSEPCWPVCSMKYSYVTPYLIHCSALLMFQTGHKIPAQDLKYLMTSNLNKNGLWVMWYKTLCIEWIRDVSLIASFPSSHFCITLSIVHFLLQLSGLILGSGIVFNFFNHKLWMFQLRYRSSFWLNETSYQCDTRKEPFYIL